MDSQDGVGWGLRDVQGVKNSRSVADASFFSQRYLHHFFRFVNSALFLPFMSISLDADTGPLFTLAMAGLAVHSLDSTALRLSGPTVLSYGLQTL